MRGIAAHRAGVYRAAGQARLPILGTMATYEGAVAFGSDGVHYPATDDGHHDTDRPLFYDAEAGGYRDKADDDPSHFEAYHQNHADLEFEDGSTISVTEAEAEAIKEKLAEMRGE